MKPQEATGVVELLRLVLEESPSQTLKINPAVNI